MTKKLEIELEIDKNLEYELEIDKNLENFESIFNFFVNFESIFEFFVISSFLSKADEVTIREDSSQRSFYQPVVMARRRLNFYSEYHSK